MELSRPRRLLFATFTLLGYLLVVPCLIQAEDWSGFRGPRSLGVSSDEKVPVEWGDEKNLKWKLELPGKGFSSPIVVGNQVLVTCYSGTSASVKRHLVSVNRKTGTINWVTSVDSKGPESRGASFGTSHGYASHTPVSDGKHIYVLFGKAGVIAFDMEGKEIWKKSVGTGAAMFGSAASPILYKDHVIVPAVSESQSIVALRKSDGEQAWSTKAGSLGRSYATPVVATNEAGVDELLISVVSEVWSLNPGTGKLNWYSVNRVDTNACPALVQNGSTVYVIGGRSPGGRAAIKLDGKKDAGELKSLWSTTGGSYVSSPVFYKDHLYWFTERGMGICVDTKTGKEVTRKRIGGEFYASALVIKDKIYAVSRFSGTHVFLATPELTQLAHNKLTDSSDFSGSPAVSDGQLIMRSDKYLYCIEAE
jgi:outer membrane protein assembly factor BamB